MPEYRYTLSRSWIGTGGTVNFIMLNPSTATDTVDDQTIRRCVGFAKKWGFRDLVVTNLFAMRATDPRELLSVPREAAIGPANDLVIMQTAAASDAVVLAWGDYGEFELRDIEILRLIQHRELLCIGTTMRANPKHPLRAAYTKAPVDYPARAFPDFPK